MLFLSIVRLLNKQFPGCTLHLLRIRIDPHVITTVVTTRQQLRAQVVGDVCKDYQTMSVTVYRELTITRARTTVPKIEHCGVRSVLENIVVSSPDSSVRPAAIATVVWMQTDISDRPPIKNEITSTRALPRSLLA